MVEVRDHILIDTDFGLMNLCIFNEDSSNRENWYLLQLTHSEHNPIYLSATLSEDMWLKLADSIQEYFSKEYA